MREDGGGGGGGGGEREREREGGGEGREGGRERNETILPPHLEHCCEMVFVLQTTGMRMGSPGGLML